MAYACIILYDIERGEDVFFCFLWKHALFRGTSVLNARLMERRGFFSMKSRHRKGFHCCGTSFYRRVPRETTRTVSRDG